MGARLLLGVAIVAWAASYLGAGSGEKEFKKTLEAMKQVHSFRVAYSVTPGTQHNEMLWEVDCNRDVLHQQQHFTDSSQNPPSEMARDEMYFEGRDYLRQTDGSWATSKYGSQSYSAKFYCKHLAEGSESSLFPQIATMIQRGIIQKGDKKTVNGVRCREWLVAMRGAPSGLEHDTVCLGLEDQLPYELTVDWAHSRATFSDYDAPIQFDLPQASVQPASSTN
jgi:hypothetical protein